MSDVEQEAPDIPPALSAQDWSRQSTGIATPTVHRQIDPVIIRREHDMLIISGRGDGNEVEFRDAEHLAALIALANAALHDEDPRKLRHWSVFVLRGAAKWIDEHMSKEVGEFEEVTGSPTIDSKRFVPSELFSELHELADVIESYLPKEKPDAS